MKRLSNLREVFGEVEYNQSIYNLAAPIRNNIFAVIYPSLALNEEEQCDVIRFKLNKYE